MDGPELSRDNEQGDICVCIYIKQCFAVTLLLLHTVMATCLLKYKHNQLNSPSCVTVKAPRRAPTLLLLLPSLLMFRGSDSWQRRQGQVTLNIIIKKNGPRYFTWRNIKLYGKVFFSYLISFNNEHGLEAALQKSKNLEIKTFRMTSKPEATATRKTSRDLPLWGRNLLHTQILILILVYIRIVHPTLHGADVIYIYICTWLLHFTLINLTQSDSRVIRLWSSSKNHLIPSPSWRNKTLKKDRKPVCFITPAWLTCA